MTAAAVDSAGAKLSTHDHERLHTGSAGAHPSRKFSSRAPRAAEAVDSPAPAVDSRASCPPTPPYLSTHENEHLDTCSAGRLEGPTHARLIKLNSLNAVRVSECACPEGFRDRRFVSSDLGRGSLAYLATQLALCGI